MVNGLHREYLKPGDAGWIGAWWLLFAVVGLVCLPVAAVIAGYPRNSHGKFNSIQIQFNSKCIYCLNV